MNDRIKVMVVDDSILMRKIISDIINEEPDMEVIDVARSGEELLGKLEYVELDIITLDVEMGGMNGIEVLKKLNDKKEIYRVLIVSSLTSKSSSTTIECLRLGAIDFIEKPSRWSVDLRIVRDDLVKKIREISKINKISIGRIKYIDVKKVKSTRNINIKNTGKVRVLVIGSSTGGPKALNELISKMPEDLGIPILIVQHMPVGFTKIFSERLDKHSALRVCEAFDGQIIGRNVVYIAPGGFHMEISKEKKIVLNKEPQVWGVRPAVDKLFYAAAKVYGEGVLSVVLTGMGKDGSSGIRDIKANKGYCISQDKESSLIYGMPKAAYETGCIDEVLSLEEMAETITRIVKG